MHGESRARARSMRRWLSRDELMATSSTNCLVKRDATYPPCTELCSGEPFRWLRHEKNGSWQRSREDNLALMPFRVGKYCGRGALAFPRSPQCREFVVG